MNRKARSATGGQTERRIGNAAPPNFMFQAVQTRVLDDISSVGQPKVIGIVAPVGYGKTVFMTTLFSRLQERGEHCFWIALDDRDNNIERVLGLLEKSVYRHSEQWHPTQALFRGDESMKRRIDLLVEAAAGQPYPYTAFIDNLNVCHDDALGDVLDRLVFDTPPSARFIFSSTGDLPLNLVRAKLAGLIRQIGFAELSFGYREVEGVLGPKLASAIGPTGIEAVTRRTEGWPAAVRMTQIVLSASERPQDELERFSGSDEDLAALLNRQVLSGFSSELREFLLGIAPLRTFCADLSRYATGCDEAGQYLEFLLRRNVFIIPLDRNRNWYRLHGLFREYLLSEAQRSLSSVRRQQILTRAARWCEQGGYWRDAIEYALSAGADEIASEILEHTATNFVRDRGDMLQYIFWVEVLHQRRRILGWETEYWYVWALMLHHRYEDGRRQIRRLTHRIEHVLAEGGEADQLTDLKRRLGIVRVCLYIFTDHLTEAHHNAARWLEGSRDDDPFDITAAHCTESICFSSAFLFSKAREAAHAAQISAFQVRSAYANGWIIALNSLPSVLEGNYALIHPELTAALASLRTNLGENTGICGTVSLIGANCSVEMGRYDEARELLALGMRTSQVHGMVDAVSCGFDAAIKLWTGGVDDPVSIPRLREIAVCYAARAGFMLSCFLVRRLARLGRFEEALSEALRIGLNIEAPTILPKGVAGRARGRDAYFAAAIDLCIAAGQTRSIEPLIAEETRRARTDGRMGRLVELTLAEMEIAVQTGNVAAGHRHLMRAVTVAATRGIVHPFDARAGVIASLVEDTKPSAWGFALNQERHCFADICRRLPISNPSFQEEQSALNADLQLLDPLTRRQIELLGLVNAGLSNQQIADRINVTLTTVKGHLQKLYAKFGVSSRAAALARARTMKLLL